MEVAGLTIAVFNEVFVIGKSIRQVLIDAGDQDNRFRRLKLDFKYQQTLRLALGKLFLGSRFIYDNEGRLVLASLRNGDFLGGLGLGGYELQLSDGLSHWNSGMVIMDTRSLHSRREHASAVDLRRRTGDALQWEYEASGLRRTPNFGGLLSLG